MNLALRDKRVSIETVKPTEINFQPKALQPLVPVLSCTVEARGEMPVAHFGLY